MLTFLLCLTAIVLAYFVYGKYLDRVCKVEPDRPMPSTTHYDGVDYVPLPRWRVFLIQLLNIAGTGPIFGAILGACYGPVVFLWITLGSIFMGGMMDYILGLVIARRGGLSLPEVIGRYLGRPVLMLLRGSLVAVLILVGVVFLRSPAVILTDMMPSIPYWVWIVSILAYYLLATLVRVDLLIGRLYPFFGAALLVMVVFLLVAVFRHDLPLPELTSLRNFHPQADKLPIFPTLFFTVACGAISGFHGTQSPLMARCIKSEKDARFVFYGSMLTESIIALIWAAAAMAFFRGPENLSATLVEHGNQVAWAVNHLAQSTMGKFGSLLVLLGVVAAPITTGDTAFRSARLMIADIFRIDQRALRSRLLLIIPLFAAAGTLLLIDFDTLWRYFAWANQLIAAFVLWALVVYLKYKNSHYQVALFPALFMTYSCICFIFISPQFIGMDNRTLGYLLSGVLSFVPFMMLLPRLRSNKPHKIS